MFSSLGSVLANCQTTLLPKMTDNNRQKNENEKNLLLEQIPSSPKCSQSTLSDPPKWTCEYCTYANYPSALACVMCKNGKPSLDIFHLEIPPERIRDDPSELFRNPENTEDRPSNSSRRAQLSLNTSDPPQMTEGKWPCAVCTYLNWSIALRCTQCLTDRDKSSSPLLDSTNAQEDLLTAAAEHLQRTLTIRRTSPDNGGNSAGAVRRKMSSPTFTVSTTAQRVIGSMAKWNCVECTYENFPKSQKCCMCGTGRVTSGETATTTNSAYNQVINNRSTSGNNSPSRISPSSTTASGSVVEHLESSTNATGGGGTIYSPSHPTATITNTNCLTPKNKQQNKLALENNLNNNNNNNLNSEERQLMRKLKKHGDYRWLQACIGVVENNFGAVEEYLSYGGSPGRALTGAEVSLLNRNSAFDVGFTLIHLAIRFQREDMLPMMLSGPGQVGIKRVPSYVAPDLAADIRRQFSTLLRIRKGQFNCHYVQEHATFALPSEIEELPVAVQEQLYEELLDKDAQKQLENPPPVLNWSLEITMRLGSRLVVLWNRSAGDCLLDSTMQATWGIFDRDNVLRRTLADSLHQCAHL